MTQRIERNVEEPEAGLVPAGAAASGLDSPEAPRRVLERIVLRRGSLRGLGQRCGRSTMWLWRQVRQNKGLDFTKTGQVLAELEVPLRFFYEEVLDETAPYDPAWLLGHFRERSALPRDLFLDRIAPRCEELLGRQPVFARGRRRRAEIAALEEYGFAERQGARQGLERLATQVLEEAARAEGPSPGELADGALILLVWAALERAHGRGDAAADAAILAYRLAKASRDSRVLGTFFHDVADLLAEQGQSAHALRFAEKACALFQLLRDRDLMARGLVQAASLRYRLGRFAEARREVLAALRLAPRSSRRSRARAWILLANLALARGERRKALARIRRAKKLSAEAGHLRGAVLWREGVIRGRLGALVAAQLLLREAIDLFARHGQALDIALVAIDWAELLIENGHFGPALAMAKEHAPCFERLRSRAAATAGWMDLQASMMQKCGEKAREQILLLRCTLGEPDSRIRLVEDS